MNKSLKTTLFFLLVCFTQSIYAQYEKIPLESLDSDLSLKVYQFGFNLYDAKAINEAPYVDESNGTASFIERYNKLKEDIINNSWYIDNYGKVEKMTLTEVLIDSEKNKIFRYKTSYFNTDLLSETRVIIDRTDRYNDVLRKYFWSDSLYKSNETLPRKIVSLDSIKKTVLKDNKIFVEKSYNKCFVSQMYPLYRTNTTYYAHNNSFKASILKNCDSVKKNFGTMKYLKLHEVLSDNYYYKSYRYKAVFDEKKDTLEIRVNTDMKNKYAGLREFYWNDEFYSENKMPEEFIINHVAVLPKKVINRKAK